MKWHEIPAFTLLETLVTLSLTSIVLLIGYRALQSSHKHLHDSTEELLFISEYTRLATCVDRWAHTADEINVGPNNCKYFIADSLIGELQFAGEKAVIRRLDRSDTVHATCKLLYEGQPGQGMAPSLMVSYKAIHLSVFLKPVRRK